MNAKNYILRNIPNLFFALLSLVIFAIFVFVSRYALPKTDDFANMMYGFQNFERTHDASQAAWDTMVTGYFNQQGTFVSGFLAPFLLVKTGVNLVRYHRVVTFFVCLAFIGTLFMLYVLAKYLHFDGVWGAFLFGTLWVAVDRIGPGEPLMQYVGLVVYGLPITLCMFAIGFYILLMQCKNKVWMVLFTIASMVSGFLACGGVLMVAAMTNMLMVLLFLHNWFVERRFPLRGMLPFLSAFASALINALAPGNFVRYANGGGGKPEYLTSIWNNFGVVNQNLLEDITYTYLLVALVIITVFVLFAKRELSKEHYRIHPLIVAIGSYGLSYIVMFPTTLGYRMVAHGYIQERTIFTFTWATAIGLVVTWTYLMHWLKARYLKKLTWNKASVVISLVLVIISTVANITYIPVARNHESKPTLQTVWDEVSSGSLNNYYVAYHLALKKAENTAVGQPCYVFYEFPPTRLFQDSCMSSDPTWWVNSTCAAVYQIPLFAYCPDHPFTQEDIDETGYTFKELLP